jgi:hypothetical protein
MSLRRSHFCCLSAVVTAMLPAAARAEALIAPVAPRPIFPADTAWAGVMLIIIAGVFVLAAVVGPIVRAIAPEHYLPRDASRPH